VLRQPSTGTTLVEIRGTKSGWWTITPNPGSAPITAAFAAHEMPAPRITAFVSGHGDPNAARRPDLVGRNFTDRLSGKAILDGTPRDSHSRSSRV
jgi:hypothetical protein